LETREHEDVIVRLLVQLRAPIPSRGQSPIDTGPAIIARSIEAMLEEITHDLHSQSINRSPLVAHILMEGGVLNELRKVLKTRGDGPKDSGDLAIFVNKHQGYEE
jgi:hypothetical protein